MKKSFIHLPALPLALLVGTLTLPATGRAAAAETLKAADDRSASRKFELSWTRVPSPELKFALERLKSIETRFANGQASSEEKTVIHQQIEEAERRASYQLTLRSSGGSLREFIAATSISDEVSFTLINAGEPADLDIQLPPFNLRNARWSTIVEVLANFLATRGLQLKLAGSDNPNLPEAKSVVCVLRRIGPGPEADRTPRAAFDSFPLAPFIATISIDDIVGAIRAGWELDPTHDKDALRLKFHPATAILLVSGPPEAITVASRIVSQLKPAPKSEPRPAIAPGDATKR